MVFSFSAPFLCLARHTLLVTFDCAKVTEKRAFAKAHRRRCAGKAQSLRVLRPHLPLHKGGFGAAQHPNSSASAKFPALRRCSQAKKQALHNFRAPTRIVSVPGPFRVSGASGRGSHVSGKAHQNPPTPSPGGPGGGLKSPRCALVTFAQSKVTENAHLPKRTSEIEKKKIK